MRDLRPIETRYKGYRFRSRTEARWAVYFDAEGITWQYEVEGFKLGAIRYLPDFWLPQVKMFAEVKPALFAPDERRKCHLLANASDARVLMLEGLPDIRSYFAVEPRDTHYEDYIVSGYKNYHVDEGRFYCSTGAGRWPDPARGSEVLNAINVSSIECARSARFEFGERGGLEPIASIVPRAMSRDAELCVRCQASFPTHSDRLCDACRADVTGDLEDWLPDPPTPTDQPHRAPHR